MVRVGLSASSLPKAPGAPFSHRGIVRGSIVGSGACADTVMVMLINAIRTAVLPIAIQPPCGIEFGIARVIVKGNSADSQKARLYKTYCCVDRWRNFSVAEYRGEPLRFCS